MTPGDFVERVMRSGRKANLSSKPRVHRPVLKILEIRRRIVSQITFEDKKSLPLRFASADVNH
jgi:hypothetical protein